MWYTVTSLISWESKGKYELAQPTHFTDAGSDCTIRKLASGLLLQRMYQSWFILWRHKPQLQEGFFFFLLLLVSTFRTFPPQTHPVEILLLADYWHLTTAIAAASWHPNPLLIPEIPVKSVTAEYWKQIFYSNNLQSDLINLIYQK